MLKITAMFMLLISGLVYAADKPTDKPDDIVKFGYQQANWENKDTDVGVDHQILMVGLQKWFMPFLGLEANYGYGGLFGYSDESNIGTWEHKLGHYFDLSVLFGHRFTWGSAYIKLGAVTGSNKAKSPTGRIENDTVDGTLYGVGVNFDTPVQGHKIGLTYEQADLDLDDADLDAKQFSLYYAIAF